MQNNTTLRNDALFYRLDAAYNLAILSVDYLKEERINEALGYYNSLKKSFPNSEYLEDATRMQQELQQELNTFNTKS